MAESHAATHAHHGDHAVHHHIVPIPVYLAIFGALLIGTALTVAVAFVDLGPANIFVAIGIAVTKATLVVLYFMHVKYSSRLVQLAAVTGFLWLGIMLSFTFADISTREWQPAPGWAPQPLEAVPLEMEAAGEHGGEAGAEGHGAAPAEGGH